MTSKLLAHFKAMQERAAYYLQPLREGDEGYVDVHGKAHGHHPADVEKAFINDMIYLLDGPEQREAQAAAQAVADQGYPTEDAYLAACRALHWRTAELRYHGIEPVTLPSDASTYPPDDYDFGPSQKLAVEQAAEWRMDLRKQIAQGDSVAKGLREERDQLRDEVNALRSRLMTSELAYARVTGYLERVEDERPIEMVPAPRERFRSHIPDGTMGTDYGGWRGGDSPRDHQWFYR